MSKRRKTKSQKGIWTLARKDYRAIIDRGRFYYVIGVERLVNNDGSDGDFWINYVVCKRDAPKTDVDDGIVFNISRGSHNRRKFKMRCEALKFAVSLADDELKSLLRKVA